MAAYNLTLNVPYKFFLVNDLLVNLYKNSIVYAGGKIVFHISPFSCAQT
jgi:hypothetical protein